MGIRPQPVTDAIRKAMKLPDTRGVLVSEVVDDAPARKAGVRAGDVITAVGGTKTDGVEHFRRMIADMAPGRTVELDIVRDGKPLTKRVRLVEFPEDQASASPVEEEESGNWLGLSVRALTADERDQAGTSGGVVVLSVESGSAAEDAGVRRGDVVLKIGDENVGGLTDYKRIARGLAGSSDPVLLRIRRGDTRLFIAIEPAE
jgi:serine protease Do